MIIWQSICILSDRWAPPNQIGRIQWLNKPDGVLSTLSGLVWAMSTAAKSKWNLQFIQCQSQPWVLGTLLHTGRRGKYAQNKIHCELITILFLWYLWKNDPCILLCTSSWGNNFIFFFRNQENLIKQCAVITLDNYPRQRKVNEINWLIITRELYLLYWEKNVITR